MKREVLDLIPLETVLFPYERLPLHISSPSYLSMIRQNLIHRRPMGIALIEEGEEFGPPPIPCDIGTLVKIKRWDRKSRSYTLFVEGDQRFRITRLVQEQPFIRVEVEFLDQPHPQFPGDYERLRQTLQQVIEKLSLETPPPPHQKPFEVPRRKERLLGLAGLVLSGFPEEKQEVLEEKREELVPHLTKLLEERLG